jgi:hypothetical protein
MTRFQVWGFAGGAAVAALLASPQGWAQDAAQADSAAPPAAQIAGPQRTRPSALPAEDPPRTNVAGMLEDAAAGQGAAAQPGAEVRRAAGPRPIPEERQPAR